MELDARTLVWVNVVVALAIAALTFAFWSTPPTVRDDFLSQLREIHLALIEPPKDGKEKPEPDLSDTITMDVRDPRYRMLLDRLDGADGVEHIEM